MERSSINGEHVRVLPTDTRDMVPSAVRWAHAVLADVATVPRTVMPAPSRRSLTRVVWVLAAAADFADRIPRDHTAVMLAQEAGVGDRTWQKGSAWLRQRGWLRHGRGGPQNRRRRRVVAVESPPTTTPTAQWVGQRCNLIASLR